jgi:FMN phosphatase YigB (HAD superfamily)
MPAVVVFDCFDTLITSRRSLPEPAELTLTLAGELDLDPGPAARVVNTVFGTLLRVMSDPAALQPATVPLLEQALRDEGHRPPREALDRVLWRALGCGDPDRYALYEPVADAIRETAAAGHTVRLLSNCFLPGPLMRRLLGGLKAPEVWDRAHFTADGGPKKPDPRAFRLIGEGDFARRVMVGDSDEDDIVPAAALGWDTVRVRPGDPGLAGLRGLLAR